MLEFTVKEDENGNESIETSITGKALLTIPQLNKGTAFTAEERRIFGLTGKLPNTVETLDAQVQRAYQQYTSFDEQINRNIHLNYLLNTNQVLFYRLVKEHLKEILPTIYTPIVGNAVKVFNKKFMHPRGLYISYEDRDHIEEILDNRSNKEVKLIVVSDGEGVLGIGDQGVGGMAIPVAKLMVYTAFAGINPLNTLPIMLDAGTNNEELLKDPLYLGWRHPRLSGNEYAEFIDKFINAVKNKFPHVFLHWEDFGRTNAYNNLVKYRYETCSFNDDIQGTGVVAIAAVLAAIKHTQSPVADQRIVIFGAGTAGMGVADDLCKAMCRTGLSKQQAREKFWLIDRSGLLTEHSENVTASQQPYLRRNSEINHWKISDEKHISLLEVVENVKPTILIGASAQPGAFTQRIIETMAQHVKHPVIFPLSNPTEKCEAIPDDLLQWTRGEALIATGSPFEDSHYNNKTIPINQCNNYLAFPGIGLGVISVKAKHVTDNMLWAASLALSEYSNTETGCLLPSIAQAQEASRRIAIAVAKAAIDEGLAQIKPGISIDALIDKNIWEPHYLPYRKI